MQQEWVIGVRNWLWALIALPVLGCLLWVVWRRIVRGRLAKFVAARQLAVAVPYVRWYARGAIFAFTLLALLLLAVTLARPLRGPVPDKAQSQGVDFVIALDVSKSMWVEDVQPNRLAAVKKELGEWLKLASGDRIGLVVFAGDAFVQAPVTYDRVALDNVLQQAGPKVMSVGGTNIPKAVEIATGLLKTSESKSKCLVIISDGENLEGDAIGAIRDARAKEGLSVFTVGVGTLSGGRVPAEDYSNRPEYATTRPIRNKAYVSNEYGTGVTSRLDNRSLRLLAEAGGGRYYEFRPGNQTFQVLRTQGMLPMIAKPRTLDVREFQEWYQLPLGAAILMLVIAKLIPVRSKRPKSRPAAVDGVVSPDALSGPSRASASPVRTSHANPGGLAIKAAVATALVVLSIAPQALAAPWDDAEKLLAAKKNDEAVELMRRAVQTEATDQYLAYNYAMTLYRAGRYEEAGPAFEAVRQSAENPALREMAAVQAGNTLTHLGTSLIKNNQTTGAILSLERALGHYDESAPKPSKQTAHNRAIAAARLESVLMRAGEKFVEYADGDKARDNAEGEANNLRNALQAYERVETLNEKNADAPRKAEEIRKRLAQNLSRQADKIKSEAEKMAADKARPEQVLNKLEQAVAKVDDALTLTPQDAALEKQKREIQNLASEVLTSAAEKQSEQPLAKEKLNDSEQAQLSQAKDKAEQAVALNPENQKAEALAEQIADKLENSFVERGQEELAQVAKTNSAESKLFKATRAADQFEKALDINAENAEAQAGLADANAQLPELLAAAADAEAKKADAALAEGQPGEPKEGQGEPKDGQGQGPPAQAKGPGAPQLRKAIGHLEKADQNYGQALGMKPADASLQARAEAVRDALNAARDQLDQQFKDALAAEGQEGQEGQEPGQGEPQMAEKPGEKPGEVPGEVPGAGPGGPPPPKKPLSMADLKQKGKPLTGDNFWEKRVRDW